MPLPRSLANLKREISEKKWVEARRWAGGRTSKKKYRIPESQNPDSTVANSTKRLASRFYQRKTGHCLTGQYLNWTKNRTTPQCWFFFCLLILAYDLWLEEQGAGAMDPGGGGTPLFLPTPGFMASAGTV